ncbi:MAG: hypothetical protein H0U71_09240 [Gammaproteobacteria bacterium]|nr:hypothetical protein [Gammaproteobacteria bacterium]
MQKESLDQIRNAYKVKTISDLEGIIQDLEKKIAINSKKLNEIAQSAEKNLGYASIEAAHKGLLEFWGNKKSGESRINELNTAIASLTKMFKGDSNNNNQPEQDSTPMDKQSAELSAQLMDSCYKMGALYKQCKVTNDNLKHMVLFVNGMIAEKHIETNPLIITNLETLLNQSEIQPKVDPDKKSGPKGHETGAEFEGIKKGFFK